MNNLRFTTSARAAWGQILSSAASEKSVLLPAYIGITDREGSGVFDPIEQTKSNYQFYPLNRELAVDLTAVKKLIEEGNISILLVIHYFGFCRNDMSEISKLCLDNGVILVEDCAHAFQLGLRNPTLGIHGDFSFFAIHKYIATDSGGILQINNPLARITDFDESDRASPDVYRQFVRSDWPAIAEIRRKNFLLYQEGLGSIEPIEPIFNLAQDDIPLNFPVRVKNGLREKLYFYLMEKGIPTIALYYRLIKEIDQTAFPDSHQLSAEILNFPVHQDTSENDIDFIVRSVRQFFN